LTMSRVVDILYVERLHNLAMTCCILLADVLTMQMTCTRYLAVLNEELCQYVYNQVRVFTMKLNSVLGKLLNVENIDRSLVYSIMRYRFLLEDLSQLLRDSLLRSRCSQVFVSLVLIINNLLRMIRFCIEDLYSSLVTTFDKHTKFID